MTRPLSGLQSQIVNPMPHRFRVVMSVALVVCVARGICIASPPTLADPTTRPYLIHLPGIGGHMRVDDALVRGFALGKVDASVEIFDWTAPDPGMNALRATARNREQAKLVAGKILEVRRASPARKIVVTCHSGGAGIAAWALEALPDDVKIDTWLMLAPALSPTYDLSTALSRVSGRAFAFNSTLDTVVLNTGTTVFGTIDRQFVASAGFSGFVAPTGADAGMYLKLVQHAYDPAWLKLGHTGNHIGVMGVQFAETVLAPLVRNP